ncbi:MAG TPA: ParB/RepB/Spo0J family partition protein [Propylenella sp.]|nr:ParB/RepB/Spo0J family partition protein [Propylenella sp.]
MAPATAIATPEVDIDRIDVVDGFNARKKMDKDELQRLADTIKESGLVQPVSVAPRDDGRYDLVSGHRRLEAAKKAGLKKVKVTVSGGNPHAEAFYENNQRVDLNPIETALGLKALAEEFNLETNKKIAAKAGKSEQWVGEHLRLLSLPKRVQTYIASGDVPMAAEGLLRPIAETSPRVAAAICEVGKAEGHRGQQFVNRFSEIIGRTAQADLKNMPTMVSVPRFSLSDVIPDLNPEKAEHKKLIARLNEVFPSWGIETEDPRIELAEHEIDAAKAAGCLVEHLNSNGFGPQFIIDQEFGADLVERAIERRHQEADERAKAEAEAKAQRKAEKKAANQKAREEREANGEETPQAAAKLAAELARRFNDDLGVNLLKRRGTKAARHGLARAKAVAYLVVEDNPDLAGRGLRFTIEGLRDVQTKPLKGGGQKEKVTYADDAACTAELLRRIDNARSEAEVMEVLTEAIIAAILADNKAEPQSRRPHWHGPTELLARTLKAEIRELRPRRPRKPQRKAA